MSCPSLLHFPFSLNYSYLFNKKLFTIPPLCKFNPLYEDLMMLRFRALSFLSEIGEDITPYCQ
ncbi:Mo-dependent nitrogenase C-terminal domain-containing protein [Cyanobacterium sp. IPPAS B-1200]|uniref:Mo-dependent nitrogenase C-terminal domain-containing protein n=1 Tax=Cyanobacterium sp. IPPAS B-1200 TaxID=1562720 RepID=UPI0008527503